MPDEEEDTTPAPKQEGKTFTQEDVDRIVETRLHKERAKYSDYDELKAKATKFDEAEDANRTEVERLAQAQKKLEDRAVQAEQKALRMEIASSKGLTPAQAKRLVGNTAEELEADADEILETLPSKQPAAPPSSKPSSTARGGTDPTSPPEPSVDDLVNSVLGE